MGSGTSMGPARSSIQAGVVEDLYILEARLNNIVLERNLVVQGEPDNSVVVDNLVGKFDNNLGVEMEAVVVVVAEVVVLVDCKIQEDAHYLVLDGDHLHHVSLPM